jgi:hypothetical protein
MGLHSGTTRAAGARHSPARAHVEAFIRGEAERSNPTAIAVTAEATVEATVARNLRRYAAPFADGAAQLGAEPATAVPVQNTPRYMAQPWQTSGGSAVSSRARNS